MDGDRLTELAEIALSVRPSGVRSLIAIAGPPASGKSTLAARLTDRLNQHGAAAVLVPMDGFHLDNALLTARGLLHRKGAPETFDGEGFVHAIRRLRKEPQVILPTFDRERDISIAGAVEIGPQDRIAVVEGNYLCFAESPWDKLAPLWDFSCFLKVGEDVLLERLIRRWLDHGLPPDAAEARARSNDLANASRINAAIGACDRIF
ncbi:sugar transporter [Tropicimonas aquimaris]|uniref:Sugar transporter n=1 Tax=Tropicimonas aquimaris TaxID=914152 RepID=A0ABW3IUA5_9RHOB